VIAVADARQRRCKFASSQSNGRRGQLGDLFRHPAPRHGKGIPGCPEGS
jgi:hypothetical protein